MYIFSPLDQFDIVVFSAINLGVIYVIITNLLSYLMLLIFLLFFVRVFFVDLYIVPKISQTICEFLYKFILSMAEQQLGSYAGAYFPFIFVTFVFILFCNLLGLMPYGFTVTAHLLVTFFLAFSYNLGFFFLGLFVHGRKFFKLFVPSGAPRALLPLIVGIEIVSYSIRSFSLAIRLFANMMAGHCLLYVVSSFAFDFLDSSVFYLVLFIIFYLLIFVLEFAIAFLQAYVFVILLCIYLNDSLTLGGH